jgi:oligoendopeptidase F
MSESLSSAAVRLPLKFLPEKLAFSAWSDLEPWFVQLEQRSISSVEELEQWLVDCSELESVLHEELAWRYIRSSCNTADKAAEEAYDFFVSVIEPETAPWFQKLNHKLIDSPFCQALNKEKFFVFLRGVQNDIALYREENIPLFTKIDQLAQQYGKIAGSQSISFNGKEMTMPQAFALFRSTDREERRTVFELVWKRRAEDREKLDQLFTDLAAVRHQVALNCGFENFRDYSFASMGRFDYTKEDCFKFHDAIEQHVVPLIEALYAERKQKLGVDSLRPYDKEVDAEGKPALKPFHGGEELIEKSLRAFGQINRKWQRALELMQEMGHFDLDSRKNKAPGGYNYSLPVSGAPFIFMNSADSHGDVITMVHEAGHAFHSFAMNDLELYGMKNPPSEVCELASMSMELITMDAWDVFYSDSSDLKRAKRDQLEKVVIGLAWIATVDQFQHWLYEHPGHSLAERESAWLRISARFEPQIIDWSGYEFIRSITWQKQLHIFEVPFYYIEYGMAQLGAVAMWREFRRNPEQAITNYEAALKLGYTHPIGAIFDKAGVKFDFSAPYVKELMDFLKNELNSLS